MIPAAPGNNVPIFLVAFYLIFRIFLSDISTASIRVLLGMALSGIVLRLSLISVLVPSFAVPPSQQIAPDSEIIYILQITCNLVRKANICK